MICDPCCSTPLRMWPERGNQGRDPRRAHRRAAPDFGLQTLDFRLCGRHRIMPAAAPRMATPNPLQRQPASRQRAVVTQRRQRVFRTARREPATPQRPEKERLGRGNHPAITLHAKYQDVLSCVHWTFPPAGFNKPAFLSVVMKSFSTSANSFPAMDARATSTRSTGAARSC